MSPANVSRSNDGAIGAMLTAVFAIAAGISAVDVAVGTTVDSTLLSMGCFRCRCPCQMYRVCLLRLSECAADGPVGDAAVDVCIVAILVFYAVMQFF